MHDEIGQIIKGLSKPQHWYLKYGYYRSPEGCWGVDRALIRKGLKEPTQMVRLTELGQRVRDRLGEER